MLRALAVPLLRRPSQLSKLTFIQTNPITTANSKRISVVSQRIFSTRKAETEKQPEIERAGPTKGIHCGAIGTDNGLPVPMSASKWEEETLKSLNIRILSEGHTNFLHPDANLLLAEQEEDSPLKKEVRAHVAEVTQLMKAWAPSLGPGVDPEFGLKEYRAALEPLLREESRLAGKIEVVLEYLLKMQKADSLEPVTQHFNIQLMLAIIKSGNSKITIDHTNLATYMGGKPIEVSVDVTQKQKSKGKVGARADMAMVSHGEQVFLAFWEMKRARLIEDEIKLEALRAREDALLSGFEPKPQVVLEAIAAAASNLTLVSTEGVPVPGVCLDAGPGQPATPNANYLYTCIAVGDRMAFLRICLTKEFLNGFESYDYNAWLTSNPDPSKKYLVPPTDVKQLMVNKRLWFDFKVPEEREVICKVLGSIRVGAEMWVDKWESVKKS